MLQVRSMAAVIYPAVPDCIKDDDPHQRPSAKILPFNSKNQNEIVYFPITVDESLSAEAQAIIDSSCGDSILYLDAVPVPHKHQSKIWIGMKAAAFSIALHAVIMGLPSAELGMVRHIMPAGLQS